MSVTGLSICMMVRNEARQLGTCLNSVRDLASELIIVDTGSTDETAEVAAAYGARLIPFDFTPVDFSAARNQALREATGGWILVLDADETLPPGSVASLRSLIRKNQNAGYYLERHNHSAGSDTPVVDHVVRVFPNDSRYCFSGRVHETIDASILRSRGKLLRSGIRIDHRFASDPEARRLKNRRYIQILLEEIAANPNDSTRLDFLAAEYHQLEMYSEAAAVAERIVKVRPQDARAHLFAGTYHLLFKPDFPQARVDFEQALKLQPDYPEAESFLRLLSEKESTQI